MIYCYRCEELASVCIVKKLISQPLIRHKLLTFCHLWCWSSHIDSRGHIYLDSKHTCDVEGPIKLKLWMKEANHLPSKMWRIRQEVKVCSVVECAVPLLAWWCPRGVLVVGCAAFLKKWNVGLENKTTEAVRWIWKVRYLDSKIQSCCRFIFIVLLFVFNYIVIQNKTRQNRKL